MTKAVLCNLDVEKEIQHEKHEFSSTFAAGQRRDMSLKEVVSDIGLSGSEIGKIMEDFPIDGSSALRSEGL